MYSNFVFSKCFVQSLFNLVSTIGWSNYKLQFQLSKYNGPQNIKHSKSGAEFEFCKICRLWGKGGPKFLDPRFGVKRWM